MTEYLIMDTTLIELADSVRNLHSTTNALDLSKMIAAIDDAANREDGFISGNVDVIRNNRVISLRPYGFYQNSILNEVSLPSVTNIGDYSFYKCINLSTVNAPLVENIGVFSFRECSSISSINFSQVTNVGNGAFDKCTNLSFINLPLLQTIQPLTFRKCEALVNVDFLNVTNIGTQAFYDSGLSSLTLRSNAVVTLEDESAFYFTPIEEGIGHIYVPSNLVDSYKNSDGWSTYANQIKAIV